MADNEHGMIQNTLRTRTHTHTHRACARAHTHTHTHTHTQYTYVYLFLNISELSLSIYRYFTQTSPTSPRQLQNKTAITMATKTKGQRPSERGNHPGTTSSSSRLEKSRKLAQKRRETYKDLMTGIMESLPFSREVLTQLDYNSRLRLGLCFLK